MRCSALANGYNLGPDIGSTGQRMQELVKSFPQSLIQNMNIPLIQKGFGQPFSQTVARLCIFWLGEVEVAKPQIPGNQELKTLLETSHGLTKFPGQLPA